MAAGAKRRWQHLPLAMCWGDPVTPSCPRGICPPQRGKTHGEGHREALCPHQHMGWGCENWFLAVGMAHLQGIPRMPSARLNPDSGAAGALLSIRKPHGAPAGRHVRRASRRRRHVPRPCQTPL